MSELKTPEPVPVNGTARSENPSGCMFFVYVNVLVASATPAPALAGSASVTAARSASATSRAGLRIEKPPVQ
jgi:hypothetical protein